MALSPFHGGQGWASFPSGHDMVIFAAAGCLWVLLPRLRPLYMLAAVLVSVGLLVADFHWLSDIVAGGLFGWIIGRFIAQVRPGQGLAGDLRRHTSDLLAGIRANRGAMRAMTSSRLNQ